METLMAPTLRLISAPSIVGPGVTRRPVGLSIVRQTAEETLEDQMRAFVRLKRELEAELRKLDRLMAAKQGTVVWEEEELQAQFTSVILCLEKVENKALDFSLELAEKYRRDVKDYAALMARETASR